VARVIPIKLISPVSPWNATPSKQETVGGAKDWKASAHPKQLNLTPWTGVLGFTEETLLFVK
jgi:hypothetical protein